MPLEFIPHSPGAQDEDINPMQRLVTKYRWLERNRFAFLASMFFVVFLTWAWFAKLEKFSIVPGSVVPQEKTQVIQHLEGGIIEDIFVDIGDQVDKNDKLFRVNLAGSQRAEQLQAELDGFVLKKARIEAELNDLALIMPEEESLRRPEIAAAERGAYTSARAQFENRLQILDARIEQEKRKIREGQARKQGLLNELEIQKEGFVVKKTLNEQGLISRVEFLEAKSRVEQIETRLKEIDETIPAAQSVLEEVQAQRVETKSAFQARVSREKVEIDNFLSQARIAHQLASEAEARTVVTAPLRGIVKVIYFNTIGGVVRPGDPVMEIVPSSSNLIIEGRLPPHERGFVKVDQTAVVKVSAYDFLLYGGLRGKVEQISADTLSNPDGSAYFRVLIKTEKNYLGDDPKNLPITPGMEITADIHTDNRSVMSYMLRPIFRLKHSAFRE